MSAISDGLDAWGEIGGLIRSYTDSDPSITDWVARDHPAGVEVELTTNDERKLTFTAGTEAELRGKLSALIAHPPIAAGPDIELDDTQGTPGHFEEGGELFTGDPPPAKPIPELDAAQYAEVRAAILHLAAALGSIPLEIVEGLVAEAQKSQDVSEAKLILQGMSREDAFRSRRNLGVELRVFRPALAWRKSLEIAAGEAKAAAVEDGIEIPTGPVQGNGQRPPAPPRKRGKR